MRRPNKPAIAIFLLLFAGNHVLAAQCWLGERFGTKLQRYPATEGSDTTNRETCKATCQGDIGTVLQICNRLGAPYVNNVEFGCFFKSDENAAELLAGTPPDFYGCMQLCECPKGQWYEAFRRQCVEPTGTAVANMPNGDKGGGYYVKDGYLFKDAGQATCRMLPSGEPTARTTGSESTGHWTPWMNRDQPGGYGDAEALEAFIRTGKVCSRPIDIQCRTRAGKDWLDAGQVYTCNRNVGGSCLNHTQAEGEKCLDYEVRFLCP